MLVTIVSCYVLQYWFFFLLQIWSLLALDQGSLQHHQMWSIGTGLFFNSLDSLLEAVVVSMVATVVTRQFKWLYNQLKVPTVSRIPYILINLSSDRPWSKARSNDSSWWRLMLFLLLQSSRVSFAAWVWSCSSRQNPPSFLHVVSFLLHPLTWATQWQKKCMKLSPLFWSLGLPEAKLASLHWLM